MDEWKSMSHFHKDVEFVLEESKSFMVSLNIKTDLETYSFGIGQISQWDSGGQSKGAKSNCRVPLRIERRSSIRVFALKPGY